MMSFEAGPPNAAEFEALLEAHQGGLLRYAYRMVRSRELSQDLVQEAFLRYLRQPPEFGNARQRASWLYRVTHNLCIDTIKREVKRNEVHAKHESDDIDPGPAADFMARERWDQLERLLENLTESQRSVIVLFFQEGRTYKEIVEITGLSMSNVGMQLHRGLKKLRAILEEERPEIS